MKRDLKIGIIGGSGLENPDLILNSSRQSLNTPYGNPSSDLVCGSISSIPVVFISRHGLDHSINPTEVNNRANIWSLKEEKCTHILAVTACGSLRKKIEPGHFVFPDQFIDHTSKRKNTFFENGNVHHVSMGSPFNKLLRNCLSQSCDTLGFKHHNGGTVITIEGPRFSTKAESNLFRNWGCDIINMSTVPEIILAREMDMDYQSIAMSTDYDCWHEHEEEVTMEMIYKVMSENVKKVIQLIKNVIPMISINIGKEIS